MEPAKPQVLLVDDDPMSLRIVCKSLEAAGYAVRTATSGDEALASVLEDCPQYLLTDWEMPGMDGVELCRRVRQESLPHYVYIAFLTAKTGSAALVEGLGAGADDFVTKPIVRSELLARLRSGERVLQLERRLSEAASTDSLTGIPSRRSFHEQFDRELSRAQRYHLPLSCVLLDVDYFKKVNDVYGHAAGDMVLKAVARVVQESCRKTDFVCRYGGEEFCALLTETTDSAALIWAERVRTSLAALRIPSEKHTLKITASFGVAQQLDDTRSAAQLIELADQALLVAKQSGRDRVVGYRSLRDNGSLALDGPSRFADPFAQARARNVMTTLVACLGQDETVGKAAEFFLRFRINSSPVVDEHGKLVGVFSEKDAMAVMLEPDAWSRTVREVMKTNVVCFEEETPAKVIYDFLCRVTLRRVVIVNDGFPTGLVSRGALLRWYNNWLAVHGHLPEEFGREKAAHDYISRRQSLVTNVHALGESARRLEREIDGAEDDFLPMLIDGASRMQEQINDLLADSRYFLESTPGRFEPGPHAGGAQAAANQFSEIEDQEMAPMAN